MFGSKPEKLVNQVQRVAVIPFMAVLVTLLTATFNSGHAQNYEGTEFYFAFINNVSPLFNTPPTFEVSIHAIDAATVTVEYGMPDDAFYQSQSITLTAGSTGVVLFPSGFLYEEAYFQLSTKTLYVSSTGTVRVYAIHNRDYFSEATSVLPLSSLGTSYRALALEAQNVALNNHSLCTIVATEDNTEIEVIAPVATLLGPANTPSTVVLNARESYTLAVPQGQDISGTRITSLNSQRIAVFSGNDAVRVGPLNCDASSHVYEQVTPIADWGTLHPILPVDGSGGELLRVVAHQNGTELYNGCDLITTLNAGQVYSAFVSGPFLLYSTEPVLVGMFPPGFECNNLFAGDPNFRLILPVERGMTELKLEGELNFPGLTLGPQIVAWFIHLAMRTENTGNLTVNGNPVTNWQTFEAIPELSYARIPIASISNQTLTASSTAPFWASLVGLGSADAKTMSLGSNALIEVPEFVPTSVNLGPNIAICQGEEILLDPGLGLPGTWQDGSIQETYLVTEPGIYSVTIPGLCGSQLVGSVEVSFAPLPNLPLPPTTALCESGVATLSVQSEVNTSYVWNTGETSSTVNVDQPGVYTLTATTSQGCTAEAQTEVVTTGVPDLEVTGPSGICEGELATLLVETSASGTYTWSIGSSNEPLTIDSGGLYSAVFTTTEGCTASASIEIETLQKPSLLLIGPEVLCPDEVATLETITTANEVIWNTGDQQPVLTVANPGVYTAVATASNGCFSIDSLIIAAAFEPELLTDDVTACQGEEARLVAFADGAEIRWVGGPTTAVFTVNSPGVYEVLATNECGSRSAQVQVEFVDCACPVYVPNAFTPDGDQRNEVFKPVFDCELRFYDLKIYNRWGALIFNSTDPYTLWLGNVDNGGFYAQNELYNWVLTYASLDPNEPGVQRLTGSVMLLR